MDGTHRMDGPNGPNGTQVPPTPTSSRATTSAGMPGTSAIMPSASSGNTITCPICNEGLPISNYLTHLSRRHPITLGWMIGLSVQQEAVTDTTMDGLHLDTALLLGMQTGAALGFWDLGPEHTALGRSGVYNFAPWIGGTLGGDYGINDTIFGSLNTMETTYEALLSICEEIGDHPTGVKDIDQVAPLMDKNETVLEGSCPICLDVLADIVQEKPARQLRQIHVCKHVFCSPCLEQWFEAKRWCPLCKTEVEVKAEVKAEAEAESEAEAEA